MRSIIEYYQHEEQIEIEYFNPTEIQAMADKIEDDNRKEIKELDKEEQVRISDLISENFYDFWKSERYGKILKGGRSSLKSSATSLKLVVDFLEDDLANIIAFRKVAKYLRTSVYEQIAWAITKLRVSEEFTFYKSPLAIEHNRTGTAFYFYGVDDPMKIKSAKISNGYIKALWFEETAEFSDSTEIDLVTDTFVREASKDSNGNTIEVQLYFTYNPPRNQYAWINEWVKEKELDPNWLVHHSTYEEDTKGFLSAQFLEKVKRIKETDPDYHDWMYLGKVIGLGDTVYNSHLFQSIDAVPANDKLLFADISADTGYSTSATTFLYIAMTLKRDVILLDTYYYSPVNQVAKKAPSDFSKDLHEFKTNNTKQWRLNLDTEVVDSADGAIRNQYYKDYSISLTPAKKKKKVQMIENVEDLLANGRVYVLNTPNNKIFMEEHKKYQWDPKTVGTDDPKVIKIDDHTCDAFQYYVNNNLEKLGLKY